MEGEKIMKKQVLTLAICFALSASTAFAASTMPAKVTATVKAPVKEVVKPAEPQQCTLTPEQAAKKRFEEKMAKDREDLYCKLNLTEDQKAKAKAMDKKNMEEAKPLFEKVQAERIKYFELKAKKACPIEISKQRMELKAAKRAVRAHFKTARKNFEAILTEEQKAKLEVIKKERRAEMQKFKNCCPCHKYRKHHRPVKPGCCGVKEPGEQAPKCPCPCGK